MVPVETRAERPGGIAKVVAECSTIAGPSIVLPAAICSSWKMSVSTNSPSLARPQWTGRLSFSGGRALVLGDLRQRRLLDVDRAVDDRVRDEVAELRRARRGRIHLRVGVLEGGDQLVDLLGATRGSDAGETNSMSLSCP